MNMTLTRLQHTLYKEMKQVTNVEQFDNEYKALLSSLPEEQKKYYTREITFVQGYVNGTPQATTFEKRVNMMKKAGYKQVSADRTWLSFDKVAQLLYKELF